MVLINVARVAKADSFYGNSTVPTYYYGLFSTFTVVITARRIYEKGEFRSRNSILVFVSV